MGPCRLPAEAAVTGPAQHTHSLSGEPAFGALAEGSFSSLLTQVGSPCVNITLSKDCVGSLCFTPHSTPWAMATHSSTLAWKIPWIGEPGRL